MRAANPVEKLGSQHRRAEQAWDCVVAFVGLAARTALPGSPAAFTWCYFVHPSAQGRRLAWDHFTCQSAFTPGFACLLVRPGQCSAGERPIFSPAAGGCLARQPGCGSGNNLQRGCCFASPARCREVLPSLGGP